MKRKKVPMRMCIGCKEMKPKNELIRIVRTTDNKIEIDSTGKKSGRGAYLCKNDKCIEASMRENKLSKALDFHVTKEMVLKIKEELLNS
ncbi:MAG: YlxR family protein [Tepidanaerobacter acetatoxydans]|uniref:RNase P modulator RnpM n=1 Tax=Tepidanaerobacter acetatoxydans TaxID=499229 RepID=UPI0026F02138|nr:YlxR family protein [Tepidanaerobacter acetatoxydans]NLU09601.1 YlxR family protein [Tepidanaerobacter acetatoxydans]